MLLNVCLLVLRLLFFEKFAGAPPWPKAQIWYEGPTSRELRQKNTLNLKIGLFKAALSYVE